ncbi:c-type cytochrome [Alteromonas halophila]|uniref:Cytochrome c n=1 Tax=Alteromonas halophila TaxID=516698 RepID=A0A918MVN8_9ALTE|nr:cytochrome c [Alteromonas halophila]GGW75678.1 cytochrome c [Alteromonas halophila]
MKHLTRRFTASAVLFSSLICAGAVAEEAVSRKHAETAIEYRQSLFQLLKSNMAPLGGMAKGALPYDATVMETNAMRIEQLADMMADYLKVDTRKFDVSTGAKDDIWDNFSDVEDKIGALHTAASNLQSVAQAGDESAYRSAIGEVGAACKSCHDDYKKD